MDKLTQDDATSHDIVADNIEKLKAIFPEAVTEGKIDFEVLKETLGEYLETREERYNFSWAGKSKARRLAQTPTTGTLRPCPEESVDWDKTENLFIEGDNLEVLKLLQKSYQGQVKMIYIDPPYNTGGDFVYPDKYADNLKGYLEYTGQVDADGNKQSSNTEFVGRYHTNWLNMMMPRIQLAKNLLRDDGAIFISIDDNELSNLRKICDEVFGEENFIANVAWKHTQQSKNDEPHFSRNYNSIVIYKKSDALGKFRLPRTDEDNKNYSNPDNDPKGDWRNGDVRSPSYRETLRYNIITPSGKTIEPPENGWRWSEAEVKKKISTGEIFFSPAEDRIIRKIYLANQDGRTPENVWSDDSSGTTRQANAEMKMLFEGGSPFDTPKPTMLVRKMSQLFGDEKDYIILDFFAGSATTGHAVLSQNEADEGNRKYILVQLPEKCNEASNAFKMGYDHIADIGKERLRRAASKIKEEHPDYEGDLGFKVFKLDSSNIEAWDSNIENLEDNVLKAANVLKDDRSELDIVYELFLKYGLDLSYPVNRHEVAGKQVYEIGAGSLFICLEDGITNEFVEALIKLYETFDSEAAPRVVFKDSGFKTDAAKKDAESTLKDAGILDVKCL